jgi:hypothetical protein
MAYLDQHSAFVAGAEPIAVPADVAKQSLPDFSPLEWTVIGLARHDRLSSLTRPGRFGQILSRLFGIGGNQSWLADPKLEALRRFAVRAWREGNRIPDRHRGDFLSAGFSTDQLDILLTDIVTKRAEPRRRAFA